MKKTLTNRRGFGRVVSTVKSCGSSANQPRQIVGFFVSNSSVWSAANKAKAEYAHRSTSRLLAPDAFFYSKKANHINPLKEEKYHDKPVKFCTSTQKTNHKTSETLNSEAAGSQRAGGHVYAGFVLLPPLLYLQKRGRNKMGTLNIEQLQRKLAEAIVIISETGGEMSSALRAESNRADAERKRADELEAERDDLLEQVSKGYFYYDC